MQQPCHKCRYVSDRPTRFCRQCGAQLFVENDATSAATRQYAPQPSSNPYDAPYQSQLAQAQTVSDSPFGNQTPDTSRLNHSPMGQNYPNYPANYQPAGSKKSGAWKWVLITLLCLVVVCGGIGAAVISAIRAKQAAAEEAREKIQAALDRAKAAVQAAEEASASAPKTPPPPIGAGVEQYKYPHAEVKNSTNLLGNNVLIMITSDSVSEVSEYYKKQLGDPMVEDEDSNTVCFQISGSPTTLITIEKDKKGDDKTQITVIKTNLQLPKINF